MVFSQFRFTQKISFFGFGFSMSCFDLLVGNFLSESSSVFSQFRLANFLGRDLGGVGLAQKFSLAGFYWFWVFLVLLGSLGRRFFFRILEVHSCSLGSKNFSLAGFYWFWVFLVLLGSLGGDFSLESSKCILAV